MWPPVIYFHLDYFRLGGGVACHPHYGPEMTPSSPDYPIEPALLSSPHPGSCDASMWPPVIYFPVYIFRLVGGVVCHPHYGPEMTPCNPDYTTLQNPRSTVLPSLRSGDAPMWPPVLYFLLDYFRLVGGVVCHPHYGQEMKVFPCINPENVFHPNLR